MLNNIVQLYSIFNTFIPRLCFNNILFTYSNTSLYFNITSIFPNHGTLITFLFQLQLMHRRHRTRLLSWKEKINEVYRSRSQSRLHYLNPRNNVYYVHVFWKKYTISLKFLHENLFVYIIYLSTGINCWIYFVTNWDIFFSFY